MHSDLNLYPPKEWKTHGWDWCDSVDPKRELEGFSNADVPDPVPGGEGWVILHIIFPLKGSQFSVLFLDWGVAIHAFHIHTTPRYPRLLLENRIYCSKVFRKLHIEVGYVSMQLYSNMLVI